MNPRVLNLLSFTSAAVIGAAALSAIAAKSTPNRDVAPRDRLAPVDRKVSDR